MKLPPTLRCGALAALLLAPLSAAAEEGDVVGHVATLHGKATAQRPGEDPRALECRDPIYRGDKIQTGDDARVGLLVGDLLAHVGKGSKLEVEDQDALALEQGAVRVLDPRLEGGHARLAVLDTKAQILGNDAEGYVFKEKTGGYAMLCEWDAPLPVTRGPEGKLADPGDCVIAKRSEPLYTARAHEQRLGSPNEDLCSLGPVIGALDLHLSPVDVAAGPPAPPWSGLPAALDLPVRNVCEFPGSHCAIAVEPVVSLDPGPGGGF